MHTDNGQNLNAEQYYTIQVYSMCTERFLKLLLLLLLLFGDKSFTM